MGTPITHLEMLQRANITAEVNYQYEGPGIGADDGALNVLEMNTSERVDCSEGNHICLEIGFGQGILLERLAVERGGTNKSIYGADIASACFSQPRTLNLDEAGLARFYKMDVSHETLPMVDDCVTHAFCTETIEHLSNPYHMFAEVKRVLRHGGYFVLSFPMPESNLGYGGGMHSHIYPGFLQRESWELFCKQMYFKIVHRHENGSSGWYILKNYKGPCVVDAFSMSSGNYDESKLFACLEEEF